MLQKLCVLSLAIALGACARASRRAPGDGGPTLDDSCEAYLNAYGACFRRLTPESPNVAQARAEHARASLLQISDHEEMIKTCTSGLAQLRASCP